jgi:hypothetical protein
MQPDLRYAIVSTVFAIGLPLLAGAIWWVLGEVRERRRIDRRLRDL